MPLCTTSSPLYSTSLSFVVPSVFKSSADDPFGISRTILSPPLPLPQQHPQGQGGLKGARDRLRPSGERKRARPASIIGGIGIPAGTEGNGDLGWRRLLERRHECKLVRGERRGGEGGGGGQRTVEQKKDGTSNLSARKLRGGGGSRDDSLMTLKALSGPAEEKWKPEKRREEAISVLSTRLGGRRTGTTTDIRTTTADEIWQTNGKRTIGSNLSQRPARRKARRTTATPTCNSSSGGTTPAAAAAKAATAATAAATKGGCLLISETDGRNEESKFVRGERRVGNYALPPALTRRADVCRLGSGGFVDRRHEMRWMTMLTVAAGRGTVEGRARAVVAAVNCSVVCTQVVACEEIWAEGGREGRAQIKGKTKFDSSSPRRDCQRGRTTGGGGGSGTRVKSTEHEGGGMKGTMNGGEVLTLAGPTSAVLVLTYLDVAFSEERRVSSSDSTGPCLEEGLVQGRDDGGCTFPLESGGRRLSQDSGYKGASSSTSFASSLASDANNNEKRTDSYKEEEEKQKDEEDSDCWEYYDDSEEEEEEEEKKKLPPVTKKKVANLTSFGIPASLLTRWDYTIWDSDSDSEEYEEEGGGIDEYSPLSQVPAQNSYENLDTGEELQQWLDRLTSGDLFKEMNAAFHSRESFCKGGRKTRRKKKSDLAEGVTEAVEGFTREKTEVYWCAGVKHGYSRTTDASGRLLSLELWRNGICTGPKWTRRQGSTFMMTPHQEDVNEADSKDEQTQIYLYPDLLHVIKGTFKGSKLIKGHFGVIKAIHWSQDGMPDLDVSTLSDEAYVYDASTMVCISRTPKLRDPYEHLQVYVSLSGIPLAGQGLFAKRRIPEGALVALFNGVRLRDNPGIFRTKTTQQTEDSSAPFSAYKIGLNSEICLDIPPSEAILEHYCATLAHKACHSFVPNSQFSDLYHPRFGHIMAITALRAIERGEEVLVSYNYSLHLAPEWYRELYFRHLRTEENRSEEFIYNLAKKKSRETGTHVPVPPPDRDDSARFVPCGICNKHVAADSFSIRCDDDGGGCGRWQHVDCLGEDDRQAVMRVAEEGGTDADGGRGGERQLVSFAWKCKRCSDNLKTD